MKTTTREEIIRKELRELAEQWSRGEELRVLEAGRGHHCRQALIYDYAFALILHALHGEIEVTRRNDEGKEIAHHAAFHALADELLLDQGLTEDERDAGESIAFVALHRGWRATQHAFENHPQHRFVTVRMPQEVGAT